MGNTCFGRHKRGGATLTDHEADTPEIVPVDEVPEENGKVKKSEETTVQPETQTAQPEVQTVKPEATAVEPEAETAANAPTESAQAENKPEEASAEAQPTVVEPQAAATEPAPTSPAKDQPILDTSELHSSDDVMIVTRTVVTEKVINEPKSVPVIIDTTQVSDTTKLLQESERPQSESFSSSDAHFEERSETTTVITKTVTTERYIVDATSDSSTPNVITTSETITENITTEEEEVINKSDDKET